jgi:hypothetical protein
MVRFVGTLRRHYPCAIAAGMWCGEVVTIVTGGRCIAIPLHELLGALTVAVTTWALLHHYKGHVRLRPGDRVYGPEEVAEIERVMLAAIRAGSNEPGRRSLRSA